MTQGKKIALAATIIIAACGALWLYFAIDPATSRLMPKCMFRLLTGYDCPACGGQRALHALLHGEFLRALMFNPFALYSIPYFLLVAYTTCSPDRFPPRLHPIVQGRIAVMTYVVLFFLWWVVRNTPLWTEVANGSLMPN